MKAKIEVRDLRILATKMRKDIVEMIGGEGHVGHLGGSCSCADVVAAIYAARMNLDPKNPTLPDRDKIIFSKGHCALAQYAALAELGYFPKEEILTVKELGSRLQGHPDRLKTPGVEANTGSLGQGLSITNGMALAMRLDAIDRKVFCILGDGELNEGQVWEAAMTASHYCLDNIVAVVDKNDLQATGLIVDRFDINPLAEKWAAFGWHVIQIDGHDMEQILQALREADMTKGKPSVIIAQTIKGKGISFAENVVGFHNGPMKKEQYAKALAELDAQLAELSEGLGE